MAFSGNQCTGNRMTQTRLAEIVSITAYDGQKISLTGEFYLRGFANFGIAQTQYITQKGYKQIGETVRDFTLGSRTIPLSIFTIGNPSRLDYWTERSRLINLFRANRGLNRLNQLTLTIRLEDDTHYSIDGFYAGGLEFQDNNDSRNDFAIETVVNFYCPNPIWRKTTQLSISPSGGVAEELVFPITFPIQFASAGTFFNTGDLAYAGNWRSYPTITIDGPYTTLTLTIEPFGTSIFLNEAIGTSEQRILTLSETGFTIVDQNGDDAFSDLNSGNLVDFYIRPSDQIESGETQRITANLLNGSEGVSGATFAYYENYIGL